MVEGLSEFTDSSDGQTKQEGRARKHQELEQKRAILRTWYGFITDFVKGHSRWVAHLSLVLFSAFWMWHRVCHIMWLGEPLDKVNFDRVDLLPILVTLLIATDFKLYDRILDLIQHYLKNKA